jgi:3-isopropylmalate/(R)-2-methylmalate dehydratase small subunit
MKQTATVHRYGHDINTDLILPGQYLNLYRAEDLKPHCLEGLDPEFTTRVKIGDVVIGGRNFGTGSSREHAPIAIKASGISCVIATSFARIFYRNAINIGLPVFECPELVECVKMGDTIDVDLESGTFTLDGASFQARPFPAIIHEIIQAGGLVPYISRKASQ